MALAKGGSGAPGNAAPVQRCAPRALLALPPPAAGTAASAALPVACHALPGANAALGTRRGCPGLQAASRRLPSPSSQPCASAGSARRSTTNRDDAPMLL